MLPIIIAFKYFPGNSLNEGLSIHIRFHSVVDEEITITVTIEKIKIHG